MAKEITYKGQTVSEDLLKQKADSLGITIDQYLEDYKDDFVITEEIQEDNTVVTDEIQTPVTEGKTNGAVAKGATATPVTGQAPENTELESVDTSGDLQLFGNYKDAIKLTAEEQAVLDNPIDFTPSGVTRELQPYNPNTGENLIKTIFDERFQDPTTGEFFEEADLIYRSDVNEAGEPAPVFQPYSAELSDAKKYLVKQGVKDPTNQQIQGIAEKNIKAKFKYQKIKSKSNDYLNSISNDERKKLIPYAVDEFINLDEKYKGLNEQYATLFNKYKKSPNAFNLKNISSKFENPDYSFDLEGLKSVKDADVYLQRLKDLGDPENLLTQASVDLYNNLLGKYKTAVESAETVVLTNGKEVPKATFNLYKELAEENQEVSSTLYKLGKEIDETPLRLDDAKTELDFLKKNYSTWQKAGSFAELQLGKAGWGIVGGAARLFTDLNDREEFKNQTIVDLYDNLNDLADFSDDLISKAESQYREKFKEDVGFDEAFDSWENFGEFMLTETAGQTGTFAMLASGQVPGAIGLGLGSYSDTRRMLEEEEDALGTEMSTGKKAVVSAGYAAAEVGLGFLPSMRIFKRGNAAAEALGKRNLINEGVKKVVTKNLKRTFLYDPLIESSTEGATVAVQNLIDIARGKEGVSIFDNVDHAAFTGGMLGATFSSMPAVKGIVLANLSDYNSYEGFRNNLKEIDKLTEVGNSLDKRTKEYKIIKKQIADLNEANNDIVTQVEQKVAANLTAEGFNLFAAATSEQESLRVQAKAIIESKDLSKKQKNIALEAIKKKFDNLQQARDSFRKDYKVNIDLLPTKERNRYVDMAKVELEQEGGEFTNAQLKQRAEKLWQVETFDQNIEQAIKANKVNREAGVDETVVIAETKADAIKAYKEAMDARAADPNNSITQEEAKQNIANFTRGVNSGRVNASNTLGLDNKTGKDTYDIVVVRENAINNGRTQTGIHEIGHTIFTEGLSSQPEAFNGLASTVLQHLKNTNESAYNRIVKRTKGKGADEVLTEFLEEVGSNRLDLEAAQNKKLLGFLSIGIPKVFKNITNDQSNFNLKGETDVVQFLESLGTKLREGSLTVKDVQSIQEGRPETETVSETVSKGRQAFSSQAVNDLAAQYKNNKESMSEQDISSLQDQYQRLGIDALQRWAKQRGVPLQVDENVISDINNQFESVMKNYTPTNRVTGKPMQLSTYVGNILGRRVGPKIVEDYTRRTGQSTITQAVEQTQFADETAEQAFEIEERAQAEESGRSKLIDVRKSPRVKKVLPTLEKEIKINEGDSSVEILNNNRSKFASEIYNVPEDKIEKVDNLTYSKNKPETSELGRIQQDFSNAQETERSIKTMPEFNVTTMESTITEQGERVPVSPEVRGRSMKIGQTVLDFFYEPYTDPASESTDRAVRAMAITNKSGRSKGKTTQTKVYRLKPEFRPNRQGKISPQAVSKAREWAGIDVDLNELSKNERRNYATKLAAWARMRGGQVALSVADKSLQESAPKQQRADTRAGRSRLMFSEEVLIDVTGARDINAVLKTLNMDSASVPDNKRAEIQTSFEDAIEKYKLTEDVFLAGSFAFGGAVRTQVGKTKKGKLTTEAKKLNAFLERTGTKAKEGDYWYALDNGDWVKGEPVIKADGTVGKKIVPPKNVTNLLPNRGRLYYGVNDPAYKKALDKAKANSKGDQKPKAKRVNIKDVDTDKGKAQAKINTQVLDDVVNQLDKAIQNGMPKELAAMVIAQGYQATTGLIKIAAPFRYFSKNPQYGTTPKQRTGDKFREEHNPPASVVGASIIYGFATNNTSQIMADIKKNYYQTKLSKADDQKLDDAKLDATLPVGTTIANNPAIRFIEAGIDLNSIVNYETGQTMAEELGVALKPSDVNVETVFEQNKILKEVLSGDITAKTGQNRLDKIAKLKSIPKASTNNNNKGPASNKFSKEVPNQEVLDNLSNADKAMANARNPKAPVKKIRVFDFDDTLARSNSQVLYEMPDGTTGKLNATQFAEKAGELEVQGAEFDFSEFSKVIDGKRGPVFKAIENIVAKRGVEDVFILTARPANAAGPIKEFMDALGVNLPIENIVGLGDGKAEAKARWMTGKAAEGYNDFFFVDDAYKNVKAVQDALDVFDVKSKTQQAKVKFSEESSLDKGFNDILENKTGIASEKEYGRVKAEVAGAGKGRLKFFIPPSAEDFVGLLYATLGKGKLGDQQMAWYKTHLLNPYARAMNELSSARIAMMNDYKLLKKQLEIVPKNLRKKVPGEPFTREQAVRVYIWNKQGMSIPGISKKDQADLSKYVSDNAELQVFADQLIAIQKGDQYAAPKEGWPAGTITTDMLEGLNTTKRAKYLEQWQQNADVIFSEKNLNKLEAAYGKPYRKAMENMLQRMKSGRNRNFQGDTLTGRVTDWLTGSIGTIMFFNTRSAILQTISSINFVNFTDNNILAAGKAFANQKQYWSDFMTLINSDFLKERRGGLRINVNEADIADMAKRGGARGVINKLLEFGFTPTQIADSFAIASGGATFYRNRIKSLKKQGMTDAEAEAQAFVDFRETAEESQQSSRPDRISMQQAGQLGRLVLAFANTPAQYARLIKKAASDLKNGRGDAKTNISKIIYYGVAQNLLFNALQQALFAFAFDDDEEDTDEQKKKYVSIANGMMDSLLRGMGLGGAIVSVGKNAIIRIINEMEKKNPKLEKVGYEITKLSPPISAKLSRINQAARSYQWDKDEMKEKGWSLDNPAYLAGANVIAALTNVPLDRAIKKTNNVVTATSQDLETWERLTLLGGWQDWEIGVDEEKPTNKPQPRKTKSTITKKRKPSKR
jgi:hypothetical protein